MTDKAYIEKCIAEGIEVSDDLVQYMNDRYEDIAYEETNYAEYMKEYQDTCKKEVAESVRDIVLRGQGTNRLKRSLDILKGMVSEECFGELCYSASFVHDICREYHYSGVSYPFAFAESIDIGDNIRIRRHDLDTFHTCTYTENGKKHTDIIKHWLWVEENGLHYLKRGLTGYTEKYIGTNGEVHTIGKTTHDEARKKAYKNGKYLYIYLSGSLITVIRLHRDIKHDIQHHINEEQIV